MTCCLHVSVCVVDFPRRKRSFVDHFPMCCSHPPKTVGDGFGTGASITFPMWDSEVALVGSGHHLLAKDNEWYCTQKIKYKSSRSYKHKLFIADKTSNTILIVVATSTASSASLDHVSKISVVMVQNADWRELGRRFRRRTHCHIGNRMG